MTTAEIITELGAQGIGHQSIGNALSTLFQAKKISADDRDGKYFPAAAEVPGRIEDYAIIGNCESAALVGRAGSIDWLALPRFDSGACFAALLGDPENGRWQIRPTSNARITRGYREGTLVLETRFETADGAVTLIDCMGRRDGCTDHVRLVRGERGRVELRMELVIRCEYGSIIPWV
jgi:GH15 family glucan-1,4-alpha-glucosidase